MSSAFHGLCFVTILGLFSSACNKPAEQSQPAPATAAAPAPAETGAVSGSGAPEPRPAKKKRWSGISMANLKEPVAGLPEDVRTLVSHVYRASPGDRAGVRKGDMITAIDGQPVHKFQDVGKVTKTRATGETFTLTIHREGKKLEIPVAIEERPDDMRARLKEAWEGAPWVPFSVEGINQKGKGKPITSDSLKGKVVVLDFWATWCGPCRQAMPVLGDLHKRYGSQGLVILGISSEEQSVIDGFLAGHPLEYQVARDPKGEVKDDYEIDKLPTLFVIDRKGIVREVGIGSGHVSSLEATVKSLL